MFLRNSLYGIGFDERIELKSELFKFLVQK